MNTLIKLFIFVAALTGTMHAQSISAVAPLKGPAGTLVTITGSGFSSTASENIVFFGKSKGNVVSVNSAGTKLKVNTPVNPSYPSVITVLNTSNDAYIESRFSFFTSFAARIDPETREIEDQFQTQILPDQTEFNGDYLSGSQFLPFLHGSEILVATDISNDGSMDFINQENTPKLISGSTTKEPANVFVNENPVFALTNPINASTASNPVNGFTKFEGYPYSNTSSHPQGLDYPDVVTSGYLMVDLNNDGEDDFVNFGTAVKGTEDASFEVRVNKAISSTFSFDADFDNEFVITAEGGQDYRGDVQNSTHVSLYETIAIKGKAADMDGDGKKDLVFLLSYPKNMSTGSNIDRKQIIVLRNTTVAGSTSITFSKSNNYPTALSGNNTTYSNGSYVGIDAAIGVPGNSWSGLPSTATDYITDFDLGDINGDGKADIIFKGISRTTYVWGDTTVLQQLNQTSAIPKTATTNGTGFLYYSLNNSISGSFSFGTPVSLSTTLTMNDVQDWGGIVVADIDVDGDLDVITVIPNNTGSAVEVDLELFKNDGSLSFTQSTIDGPSGSNYMIAQIKVADLNGDELPDVLATISKTNEMRAFMRKQSTSTTTLTGSSFLMKGFTYPNVSPLENPLSVAIADFSNDGKVDLVLQEHSGNSSVLYLKNDDGLPQIFSSVQLSDFSKCSNQTSAVQTFQIGGQTISRASGHYILITAPTGWEVCKDPSNTNLSYQDTIRYYPNTNNEVMPAKTVSIRMKASENNSSYKDDLEISTFNAATVAIELKGYLDVPSYSAISPSTQYVNTTNSNTQNSGGTIPTPSPAATSSPVAVELGDVNGTVQWQKSTDNSTWSEITGATATTYTLPDADLNNQGIVYLRAQITACATTATTEVVTILENLGIPSPPIFSISNGQTLSGTFDESLSTTLAIYDNMGAPISSCSDLTGSTCTDWSINNGTFTYTPSSGYSDGSQFYAVATSSINGSSENSNMVIVDATAPSDPSIAANPDGSTVTGTAEAGSTVTLSLNDGGTFTTVDVVTSVYGTWEYVPVPTLSDGVIITAISTDAVGNQSNSSSSVTVDAIAPTLTPAVSNSNGTAIGSLTEISGTTEAGASVVVTTSSGATYTTIADQNGIYSVDISSGTFSDGDVVTVIATDAAGNTSASQSAVIDAIAPSDPNVQPTNGSEVTGTAEAGGTVEIAYTDSNGNSVSETVSVASTGEFTFTPTSTIADGTELTITCYDPAGNPSTAVTETVDGTAPSLDSDFENGSGAIASASTISGTSEAGSTVTLTLADGTELTQTAATGGTFSFDVSSQGLSDGDLTTIISADAAGNESSLIYTIDDTEPSTPGVDDQSGFVGSVIEGTTEPGATVTLSYLDVSNQVQTIEITADSNGDYTYTNSEVNPGSGVFTIPHNTTVTITSTDEVGNVSTGATVTMDLEGPSLTAPYTNSSSQSYTNATTLTGTTDILNGQITVTIPGVSTTVQVPTDGNGDYSLDLSSYILSNGDQITVEAEDDVENSSSLTVTVDDSDPLATIHASNGSTFAGVLDGEDYSVSITYGSPSTTQTASINGTSFDWTPSPSLGLSAGDIITYTITDAVGNETTYEIPLQSIVHCRPAHTTGLTGSSGQEIITQLNFSTNPSSGDDFIHSTSSNAYSNVYNDCTTRDTLLIDHDNSSSEVSFYVTTDNENIYYQIWVDKNQDGDFNDPGETMITGTGVLTAADQLTPTVELSEWSNPFNNMDDGKSYVVRIGASNSTNGVSNPCGTAGEEATFFDLRFIVLNCELPQNLTMSQNSPPNGTQLDIEFDILEPSMDMSFVIAEAAPPSMGRPQEDPFSSGVDQWLEVNNTTASLVSLSGTGSTAPYSYTHSVTVDSEGNSTELGRIYTVSVKKTCYSTQWESLETANFVELSNPSAPDYLSSSLAINSSDPNFSYTQNYTFTPASSTPNGDNIPAMEMPDNVFTVPVGYPITVETTVEDDNNSAVTPTRFFYIDVSVVMSDGNNTAVEASLETVKASSFGVPVATNSTNSNVVEWTINPSNAKELWLSYTFDYMPGMPTDNIMYAMMNPTPSTGAFAKALSLKWVESPVWNSASDGFTGCLPNETVTIDLDGVTYTATADSNGDVLLTDFTPSVTKDDLDDMINGSYSVNQSWTSGGISHTHDNPTISVLSGLSINAATNSVTGTAAPGATVTLTIGDETFTTTADATTGIYDFAGTTSSTTSPSTGVDFNTLVPFTATTSYSINQSLTGYTSGAAVTGSILASASDIAVPTIGGALALSGSTTTVAGTAEAGSQVYLYDEDGNQLFDANGDPITTTADDQGAYSITVDLSAAQISTGSNTFASAYTSPYTGAVIQVGSTDTDGNTAPLSAAFVNPSVYTSGNWTDASDNPISAPSTSGAATSSSPVIRYESNATLPSGITGLSGVEVADGATLTVPTDGCLDVAGSLAVQGTGSISLGAAMNADGDDIESAQLKFTGEYLGPPTLEMNGQLFKSAHTIGSPMKEGFVSSDLGDETKLIGWDAYTAGKYYSAGEAISTQGLGFYAIVGSSQFIAQAGGFDVIGSPMSSLDMSLGYVADNYSGTSAGSGWNMIANPYTCGWNWGNSTLTNVSGTFYIYDVSNSSWMFWNSATSTGIGLTSAVIPPLQGIWVQATSANATVSSTMDAAGELTCASGSSQNGFLKAANGIYKLTTSANGDSSDYSEMYLVDIAGATDGFDANYDAWHMNGHLSRGKLYNVAGAEEIVLNALEIDSSKIIDLAFDSDYLGTTYELNLTTSDVDSTLKVVLEDRYEGTLWSMDNGAYTFVHSETPVGMKQTRFALRYYQEASNVVGEEELDEQVDIAVAGTTITVPNPEAYGEYQVYDASGRLMIKGAVIETITLPADNWENGIYRLVFVGEQITTISIVVNK